MPPILFDVPALRHARQKPDPQTTIVSDPNVWYGELEPLTLQWSRTYNDFAANSVVPVPGPSSGWPTIAPWRGDGHLI